MQRSADHLADHDHAADEARESKPCPEVVREDRDDRDDGALADREQRGGQERGKRDVANAEGRVARGHGASQPTALVYQFVRP
jgi:hypothetical protein